MTRAIVVAACLVLAAGCGDPDLWTRYRAERAFWRAGREIDKIRVNPRLAADEDYLRVARAFRRIAEEFPAERWASPEALARPYAMDIATLSGRAAVAALRFGERRGAGGSADAFGKLASLYARVPRARREALTAEARALQTEDRHAEAAQAWLALWNESESVDAAREQVEEPIVDAPFGAAQALRMEYRLAEADSVLETARARFQAEAKQWHGRRPAAELWRRAATAAEQSRNPDGAIAALRGALGETDAKDAREPLVVGLAERHLEAKRPDSALVYTAWALRKFESEWRTRAALLAATAWEQSGRPDSALAALNRLLDGARLGSEAWAQGRFARAELLVREGRWEQARGEYRALVAGAPMHALGIRAQAAIVRHHAEAGEKALAEIEARHALESVDRVLEISRGDSVQVAGRRCRAEIFEALGKEAAAIEAYVELWRRFGRSPVAAWAGLRGAELAERRGERERSIAVYRELAAGLHPEARREAREALIRLRAGGTSDRE